MTSRERSALIIGTSRGLGLRLVQQLRQRGWSLVATVRDEHTLPLSFGERDERLEVARLDVTNPTEIAALTRQLVTRRFDLLFVNAGVTNDTSTTIGEVTTEDFVHVMITNVLGPMRCVEAFAPLVRERGTIAVMSSGLGSIADNTTGGWEVPIGPARRRSTWRYEASQHAPRVGAVSSRWLRAGLEPRWVARPRRSTPMRACEA
jgi:NAD(P)-dependent dehydrogenase (short-subunit alcohol dehydrogenase family)